MAPVVEALPLPPVSLGEGPHWNPKTKTLYLVDIIGKAMYSYQPDTKSVQYVTLDVPSIGFATPVSGSQDKFLIGAGTALRLLEWNGKSLTADSLEVIQDLKDEPKTNRINDGKADPSGRIWFGTMKTLNIMEGKEGSFYSYSKDEGLKKHLSAIGISNGLSWNVKKNTMYYIDSLNKSVDAFDYDTSGKIGNRRVIFDFDKNGLAGFPDGHTNDTEGKLWVACYSGSKVIRIDPDTGKLLSEIPIPTLNVTSVAWGGPDLSELYVTSANAEADPINGGKTFRVTGLGCKGLPMDEFKV